ncbi:MAG: diaminopimelate epimerase [Chloroflexota bacterium]|nr:diaminopimelate epimerase [Dehalococcoidia bacterium]MDW8253894.1 diaminopimelate epimerase [Chloroflexota bacterium]
MRFAKMHGIGNDFVMVDARAVDADWPALAKAICDRHYGVGADGLILVLPSERADLRMRIFNPDGSEAEMCGNGIRCYTKFVLEEGLVPPRDELTVETGAGVLTVMAHRRDGVVEAVSVDMGPPRLDPAEIPVDTTRLADARVVDYPLVVDGETLPVTCVSMGNPHAVTFVEQDLSAVPLETLGPKVERHPFFPQRVNFEVARVRDRRRLDVRVWERGAGLTLACGTGACAAVVAARLHGLVDEEVDVRLPGGALVIRWDGGSVQMRGPAAFVFRGEWPLDR